MLIFTLERASLGFTCWLWICRKKGCAILYVKIRIRESRDPCSQTFDVEYGYWINNVGELEAV